MKINDIITESVSSSIAGELENVSDDRSLVELTLEYFAEMFPFTDIKETAVHREGDSLNYCLSIPETTPVEVIGEMEASGFKREAHAGRYIIKSTSMNIEFKVMEDFETNGTLVEISTMNEIRE